MFLVIGAFISLVAAQTITQATCPTQLFVTQDAYDHAVGNPGLTITWWHQNCDLIANHTSTSGFFPGNPCTTAATGHNGAISLQNTDAFQLFSLQELQQAPNQEQNIFIFTNINTTVDNGCFLLIGEPKFLNDRPSVLENDVGAFCLSQKTLNVSGTLQTTGFVSFPGQYEFPISFGNTPNGILDLPIGIYIHRHLDVHNNILIDVTVETGAGSSPNPGAGMFGSPATLPIAPSSVTATNVQGNGVFFDIKSSRINFVSVKNSTTSVNNVLVLTGTFKANQTFSTVLAEGVAFAAQTLPTTCVDEFWSTSGLAVTHGSTHTKLTNGFVVPAGVSITDNARLVYTRVNYGAVSTSVQFPVFRIANDLDPSHGERNAFAADGYQFKAPDLVDVLALGVTTHGGHHTLTHSGTGVNTTFMFTSTIGFGQASSLRFTFGVEQCTLTALPLEFGALPNGNSARYPAPVAAPANIEGAIGMSFANGTAAVVESAAYIFIQRESMLTAATTDLRNFDSNGRPIAAGCNVPFAYTFDVFNAGPSCATDLTFDMSSGIFVAPGITVTSGSTYFINETILPGTLSSQAPFTVMITANGTTPNLAGAARFVRLLSPTGDCVTSADTNGVCADESIPLFRLFYDVQAYADISVTSQQLVPSATSVTAGEFAGNLVFQITVASHGCSPVSDVTIDVDIETPDGVVFLDINADGTLNNDPRNYGVQVYTNERFIRREVNLGNFAPGVNKTFLLEFIVCQNARAGAGGVRVTARFSPQSSLPDQDVLQSTTQVGATVAFTDPTSSTTDYKISNPEDDSTTIVGKVNNAAAVHLSQSCTDPVVVPRGVRPEEVLEDDGDDRDGHHHRRHNDIEIQKFSVCTLTVFNDGASDVALRLRNEWDLPNGVHVAKWETTGGVFSNNVWVVDTPSIAPTAADNATAAFVDSSFQCPDRVANSPATLTVTLVANAHGIVQWVTKLDTSASAASFSSHSDTGAFTSIVF